MSANIDVIAWYCDQIVIYLGIIISIVLLILTKKRLVDSTTNSNQKTPKPLQFWIYAFFISNVFQMFSLSTQIISLPIIGTSINQSKTCQIVNVIGYISGPLFYIAEFNLFMERLYLSFKNSLFAISKCKNYTIRVSQICIWIVIGVAASIIIDTSPYNIYTSSVDFDGNGVTCSIVASGGDIATALIFLFASSTKVFGNMLLWILFMRKLYKVIKFTKATKDKDMIMLMKEQTLIVALMLLSTLIFYTIQIMMPLGQVFIILDFVITPCIVFLCFKFNRYYFEILGCDKLAQCCCSTFEKRIIGTEDERNMAEMMGGDRNRGPSLGTRVCSATSITNIEPSTNTEIDDKFEFLLQKFVNPSISLNFII